MLDHLHFNNPEYLWLLLLIPLAIAVYVLRHKKEFPSLKLSSTKALLIPTLKLRLRHLLFAMKMIALLSLIIAIARPQSKSQHSFKKSTEGIDIVMAIDVSTSMLAQDLKPNRLEALRKVASKFISERPSDRIGIVVYAGEGYTKMPITSDKRILLNALKEVSYGQIQDGTAIGTGLATAINRLKDSPAKSKVIILLTDGENTAGAIEPITAAEIAKEFGIKVYTIGVGSNSTALSPVAINPDGSFVYQSIPVKIDEPLLKDIAKITGGSYFRASSNQKLEQIYNEIDQLETSKTEEITYFDTFDYYRYFALLAFIVLVLEQFLRYTIFKGFL